MKITKQRLRQIIKEELSGFGDRFLNPFARSAQEKQLRADEEQQRQAQQLATSSAEFDKEQEKLKATGKWWYVGAPVQIYVPKGIEASRIKGWLDKNASARVHSTAFNENFLVFEPDPVDIINPVYMWSPRDKKMVDVPKDNQ